MSILSLDTYAGQVARLDEDYIEERGRWVDSHLAPCGEPIGLCYEPGNGTCYLLCFVPAGSIEQLGDRNVPAGLGDGFWNRERYEGKSRWTLVAKANLTPSDFTTVVDLTPGNLFFASYVAERVGNFADACALTALFRAIVGQQLVTDDEKAAGDGD